MLLMALPVLNRAAHPDLLRLTSTAILGAEKPLLKRMALTYLAGDFGDLVDLHNSENNYPACAGLV